MRMLLLYVEGRDDYAGFGAGTNYVQFYCRGVDTAINSKDFVQREANQCLAVPMRPRVSNLDVVVVKKGAVMIKTPTFGRWDREVKDPSYAYTTVQFWLDTAYPLTILDRDRLAGELGVVITRIDRVKPRYMICAHLHSSAGSLTPWKTLDRISKEVVRILSE
jgi:hypothetical protein